MPTFATYWLETAKALDDLNGPHAVSSATASTVVAPILVNNTAEASTTRHSGAWLHVVSGLGAGQTRRVRTNGYTPATGTLAIETNWIVIPDSGSTIVLTGMFPVIAPPGGDTSYLDLVNMALRKIVAPDRIELAIITSHEYALTTWAYWLDRDERLVNVLEPSPVSGGLPRPAMWRGPRLRLDASGNVLEVRVPFLAATGNLYLDVLRPSDSWIRVGGVWGESTVGLASAVDEAKPSVNDVVTVALAEAYYTLMGRSVGRPAGKFLDKFVAQRDLARAVKFYDKSQEVPAQAAVPEGVAA